MSAVAHALYSADASARARALLPVDLPLGISACTDCCDLFNGGHVFTSTMFEGLSEVMQANQGSTVVCSPLVISRSLQILEQVRLQHLRAVEISSND